MNYQVPFTIGKNPHTYLVKAPTLAEAIRKTQKWALKRWPRSLITIKPDECLELR